MTIVPLRVSEFGRASAQFLLTTVLKNKRYGLSQILAGLVLGPALTVGPRNFRATGDMLFPVLLDNRHHLVFHSHLYEPHIFWNSSRVTLLMRIPSGPLLIQSSIDLDFQRRLSPPKTRKAHPRYATPTAKIAIIPGSFFYLSRHFPDDSHFRP